MEANFYGRLFVILRAFVRKVYPTYSVEIFQNVNGPVVYIAHHQNLFGPFVILLWFPKCLHAWILHVFLNQAACYKQYVGYTFTKRFGWNRSLIKMLAFPISYFVAALLNSGKGIPVYRGSRKILDTFQLSVKAMLKGESIVIFPDVHYSDPSSRIKEMYDGFVHLEKYYYRASGQHVCFVPLYVSKNKRLILANEQIYFREGADYNAERKRVCQKIKESLNDLAKKCGDHL